MTPTQQEAVRLAIEGAARVTAVWDGAPVHMTSPTGSVRLKPTQTSRVALFLNPKTIGPLGHDEIRQEYNPTTEELELTATGQRSVILSCRVEAYGGDEAYEICERIRSGLRLPSRLAALRVVGVAYAGFLTTAVLPLAKDNRDVSYAVIDLSLGVATSYKFPEHSSGSTGATGTNPGGGWIETVESEWIPPDED